MADPHKVSTIYSSFLHNLLPTPSYPSSARLSWSVSYTDLTPNRTRKWKCRSLDQTSLAGNWQSSSHVWGAWTSTVLPGLQVSEDTRWETPPPLLAEPGSTPYNGTHRSTVLLEVLSSFIWFWAGLVPKSRNSPCIIAMHSNQYNFPYTLFIPQCFPSSGPIIHSHHLYHLAIS